MRVTTIEQREKEWSERQQKFKPTKEDVIVKNWKENTTLANKG